MSKTDKPMKNVSFKFMSSFFALRDKIKDPMIKVRKANIISGNHVLDYGCGPGTFSIEAAKVVGDSGKVYALDIQPLSGDKIKKRAVEEGLNNIETITTNCSTGLEDNSIDVVMCFDMFHMSKGQQNILEEIHRVLKPNSIFSFDCHHMKEENIKSIIVGSNLFKLIEKIDKTYNFKKI